MNFRDVKTSAERQHWFWQREQEALLMAGIAERRKDTAGRAGEGGSRSTGDYLSWWMGGV